MEQLKSSRKLLTLNTHSFMEPESIHKLRLLAYALVKEEFDVTAFQEVNQSMEEMVVDAERLRRSRFCGGEREVDIKRDNYGLLLAEELASMGVEYYWTWAPSHIGYDRFDEGIALFSKNPILEIKSGYVSETADFRDPHARMVVGIRVKDGNEGLMESEEGRENKRESWYYSVHLSRWSDGAEHFARQWEMLEQLVGEEDHPVWIMGDFNSPAQDMGEGYSFVMRENRWKDCFVMADGDRESGGTVRDVIDGWRDTGRNAIRIDYIMVNQEMPVLECKTVFDGTSYPIVSDHYGVMAVLLCPDEKQSL